MVETLRHALNILSVVTPNWLQRQVQPDWLERYGSRASEYRFPSAQDQRHQFLQQVGQDGWRLLLTITTDPQSQWMLSIHAALQQQDLLPHHHLVDAGYVDAEALLASQSEYHVDLVGPTAPDHRGPGARAQRLCLLRFVHRLGTQASPVSARAPKSQLDANQDAQAGSDQNQVWLCDLWSLSRACALHPIEAADLDRSQAPSLCGLGSGTPT